MKTLLITLALSFLSLSAQADAELENELALIESWLGAQRAYDNVPAISAAVLLEDELAWSGGFGLADIETGRPAQADTIYGICSISKLFTGVAVMQLRDAGKFSLDDPLEKLLPWFELEQSFDDSPPITMRAVLTHSAGLFYERIADLLFDKDIAYANLESPLTRQTLREEIISDRESPIECCSQEQFDILKGHRGQVFTVMHTAGNHMADMGVDPLVADRILNHVASSTMGVVQRTYQRSNMLPQRREALERWAAILRDFDA